MSKKKPQTPKLPDERVRVELNQPLPSKKPAPPRSPKK